LAGLEPIRVRQLEAGPGPADAALDLAALHREILGTVAGIAANLLELGCEKPVQRPRSHAALRALHRHDHRPRADLLPARYSGRVPNRGNTDLGVETADPIEVQRRLEGGLRVLAVEQRLRGEAAVDDAPGGAIPFGDVIKIVHREHAPGTGHVARHDARMSGYESHDMLRHEPGIEVVAGPGFIADIQIDRLAREEVVALRQARLQPARQKAERRQAARDDRATCDKRAPKTGPRFCSHQKASLNRRAAIPPPACRAPAACGSSSDRPRCRRYGRRCRRSPRTSPPPAGGSIPALLFPPRPARPPSAAA